MKLNKFLTVLTPIAIVGAFTPTIVSCSKKNSFVINYGDNINCVDKKDESVKYHSLKQIQNAIKVKVNLEPKRDVSIEKLNQELANSREKKQNVYYEVVATKVLLEESACLLKDWEFDLDATTPLHIKFTLDGTQYDWADFKYRKNDENQIYLNDGTKDVWPSYIYKDCKGI